MMTLARLRRALFLGLLGHGSCAGPTPSASLAEERSGSGFPDASAPPEPQPDAGLSPEAAAPAHSSIEINSGDAGPPVPTGPARALVPGRGVIERPREDGCKENHASCHPNACFRTSQESNRPATPAALLRCERDLDCSGAITQCAGREGIDARAVRADAIGPWKQRLCGAPTPPDPRDSTLIVGCIEGACRTVVHLSPEWCSSSKRTFTIIDANEVVARPVRDDCAGYTRFCPSPESCYKVVRPTPDRPSLNMAQCRSDAECVAAPMDCCDHGPYRAIRRGAEGLWRGAHRCPNPVTCPAVVGGYFGQTACVAGRCELLDPASGPMCASAVK
jgi:hypothetical protein